MDRKWIVNMAAKANLKKYLAIEGKWQFVPVLKVNGTPKPATVLIGGKPVQGTEGTFYVEWRENGKRRQEPVGGTVRGALDGWRQRSAFLSGEAEQEPEAEPVAVQHLSIERAFEQYLTQVGATKSPGTLDAYRADLAWVKARLQRSSVGAVTRRDILHLLGVGRAEKLSQASINRRVMVGLMALRDAGAQIKMEKSDWPRKTEHAVEVYDEGQIRAFFAACTSGERLLFQTFLLSGFRAREVSTLDWASVDFKANTLAVVERPPYGFTPKSHECRKVRVPLALIETLKQHRKESKGALVFPTPPHPKRPFYGGDQPDSHHLEMCKKIALRAGLNCGTCEATYERKPRKQKLESSEARVKERNALVRRLSCAKDPCCEHWKLHKFRHTMATNMLRSGLDLRSLQSMLGHKGLATTEKYLKALGTEMMEDKIENSILAKMMA